MRNDYDDSGTITDNATDIVFDAEEQLLYDTSFSFFDFLWYDLDQVVMNGGVTVREDEYFGGTISELDLYLGGDGNVQFNGADLSKVGSKWRNIASNLLSKPGRDTAFLDINNLNFGRGSKAAAREFASNLIWNYGYMPMAVENCGAYEVRISDKYVEYGDCGIDLGGYAAQEDGSNVAGIITRTFIINDFSFRANTDTAQIQLIFRNPNLTDLRLPNYTVNIDCDELDGSIVLLDNGLPSPVSTGYPFIPTLTGFVDLTPSNSLRNLGAAYEDKAVVEGCAGNRSFRREWTVYDWCRPGTTVIYHQLIRVGDWTAPIFTVNSTTISSSFSADECAGVAIISRGQATDNCGSSFIDITVYRDTIAGIDNEVAFASMNENGSFNNVVGSEGVTGEVSDDGGISLEHLPSGSYLVRWVVRAECGNRDTTHNTFAVQDQVAPSCVIDDMGSITLSDFGAIGNETEIESQPERGQAWVTAERLDEGSWDNCGVIADIKVRRMMDDAMTEWGDAISFTCNDEGLSILVELKVTDESNNETICWTNIVPVDKTQPECRDIVTVNYYCNELPSGDDLSGEAEVWGQFFDDSLTLVNISKDELCNSNMEVFDTEVNIDQCGYGWVNRYYRVYREIDGKEFADSCRMSLVFSENHQYSITFPADVVAECSELADSGVTFEEGGCDLITVSTTEERYDATADECYKIFRTFNVINWCEYEEESVSPFEVSRWDWDGDGKEGDGTTVNINYKEGIRHIFTDYQGGGDRDTILNAGVTTNPSSTNVYWESQFPMDLVTPSALIRTRHNYGYYSVVNSTNAPGYFQYTQVLKVYDDEEPTITYTADQDSFPSFSNAEGCPGDVVITASLDDDCTSDINQVTVTEAYLDQDNDAGAESVDFDESVLTDISQADGQVTYTGTDLPAGTHRLRLVARDGCGNVRVEDYLFTVYDAKGPAPICIEGFAVELMPMEDGQIGMAEVQAKDFVVNAPIADCSGESGTYYITRLQTSEGVQKTADEIESATTTSLLLNCSDKGSISVAVIATDQSEEKNKDYCVTTISVQDNVTPCPEVGALTGIITTEENETVSGVYLQINGTALGFDRITKADGSFEIGGLTIGEDYTIAPSKTEDLLNGISTFDLVLISKHILGTSLLDSPYKLIAADVNNSGTISTLDLIILRQNLLLQRADFAGNTSWRFVPTTYSFPSPQHPWSASFPEVININDLQGSAQVDFVAIKVGDVNNSAINDVQPRTNNSFVLSIPNLRVEEGKEYEVQLKGNLSAITGFQTGLKWNGLEIISIEESLISSESFNFLENEKTVLISWMNNESSSTNKVNETSDLVRIKFKAIQSGVLQELVELDQRNLTPEAYNTLGMVEGLNIEFTETELTQGLTKLMQNLPNPFKQATTLEFFLGEAGPATLTITDITGGVVKTIRGNFPKGTHRVEIIKDELTSGGVYYYTLTSGSFVSTRKMVLIE
jgi:hypothetical protein